MTRTDEDVTLTPADLLERSQWDFFWIPADARAVDRPELAYLCCPRDVPILNCVTRTRAPARRLPAVVAEVGAAHRGVASQWLVRHGPDTGPLQETLAAAGYEPAARHHACAIACDAVAARPNPRVVVRQVSTMAELHRWVDVAAAVFGSWRLHDDEEMRRYLAACTGPKARVARYVAYDTGNDAPIAAAGLTLFSDLRFGLLWAGGTVPEARGRGAYSALVAARAAHALRRGCNHVGLYALTTTSAPIVMGQGFSTYGEMTYWLRPEAGGAGLA